MVKIYQCEAFKNNTTVSEDSFRKSLPDGYDEISQVSYNLLTKMPKDNITNILIVALEGNNLGILIETDYYKVYHTWLEDELGKIELGSRIQDTSHGVFVAIYNTKRELTNK